MTILIIGGILAGAGLLMVWSTTTVSANTHSCGPTVSKFQEPEYIKVYHYGKVYKVLFKRYVKQVMARGEWPAHHRMATLKAGAQATKQYAWYFVKNWRGYSAGGKCFHVYSDTRDQMWSPNSARYPISSKQHKAVATIWGLSISKWRIGSNHWFATGYRAGHGEKCGADATGWKLYAGGAARCARQGKDWKKILKIYYWNTVFTWKS